MSAKNFQNIFQLGLALNLDQFPHQPSSHIGSGPTPVISFKVTSFLKTLSPNKSHSELLRVRTLTREFEGTQFSLQHAYSMPFPFPC